MIRDDRMAYERVIIKKKTNKKTEVKTYRPTNTKKVLRRSGPKATSGGATEVDDGVRVVLLEERKYVVVGGGRRGGGRRANVAAAAGDAAGRRGQIGRRLQI